MQVKLKSTITCPECGHKKEEEMPTDACQYFYECEACKFVMKQKKRRLLCILFVWNSCMSANTKTRCLLLRIN